MISRVAKEVLKSERVLEYVVFSAVQLRAAIRGDQIKYQVCYSCLVSDFYLRLVLCLKVCFGGNCPCHTKMFLGHRHRTGVNTTRSSLLELSRQLSSLFPTGKEKNAFVQSEELFQGITGIQDWEGGKITAVPFIWISVWGYERGWVGEC